MILPATPTTMTRPVLIFANPFSGTGPNRDWVEAFADRLTQRGLAPEVVWDPAERRGVLAERGANRNGQQGDRPLVVAAGGDGSIAAVLNDMAAADAMDLPFATLPVGNENLFARHFQVSRKRPDALADALAVGETRAMDLGRVQVADGAPRLFSLMLGAGFDADVVHRVDRWRRNTAVNGELRRVSWNAYARPMAGALGAYRYPPVTLTPDNGEPVTGAHAFVFNLPEYGKDLGICRAARADDGLLNWVVFEKPGRLRLMNYLRAAAMGRHLHRPDVKHGTAESLTLTADADVPLQADGDPAGTVSAGTSASVSVDAGALRVIGPGA